MRRDAALALLLLAAGWAATLWVAPWSDDSVSDLFVYRSLAEPVLGGALPYRDVFVEYPPLAVPAISLPGVAGTGEEAFEAAFAAWSLLLAAAVVLLCGALAARSGGERRRALFAAALMPLLLGALVRTRFDLAPVAMLLGALLLLARDRPRSGMALLGLAAMTKGFPLLAAPPALAWLAARSGRRTVLQAAAALLAALALPAALAFALSPAGTLEALDYHLERPIQVESLPASGVLLVDALGGEAPRAVDSHRSDGLEHAVAEPLALACLVALVALIALATARSRGGSRELVLGALAAVAALAVLGKVLSPQYVLWLIPLGALAFAWRLHALAAAVALAALLTHAWFPGLYPELVEREPLPLLLVSLRNLVLLAVLGLTLRALAAGGEQKLPDRAREPAGTRLDDDRVQPRVLV